MTDAEKIEILRIALRDITYIPWRDPAAGLERAQDLAYTALKDAGFIPPRGQY
jgi:hypothetical protein